MHSYYRSKMNRDAGFYDALVEAMAKHQSSISLSCKKPEIIYGHVLYDYPEFFYVKPAASMGFSLFGSFLNINYIYNSNEERILHSKLEQVAQEIISKRIRRNATAYDKVRIFHDYLQTTITYDIVAMNSRDLNDRTVLEAHSVIGALLNHKAVCDGFAKAMKYLCDKVGVECWVVTGEGMNKYFRGPHAWNIVKIDGYYQHVDVTWDTQFNSMPELQNYTYFNLTDEEICIDHSWNRQCYPACSVAPNNYFRVNDAVLRSAQEIEAFVYRKLLEDEEYVMFKITKNSPLARTFEKDIQKIMQNVLLRHVNIAVKRYNFGYIKEQQVAIIHFEY